jgi:glycosyltransferase involved in cell wall biosynthesis
MRKLQLLLIMVLFITSYSYSQNKNEFKPEIKIGGTVFTGWTYNSDNSDFIGKLDTSVATGVNSTQAFGFNPIKNQFETGRNSFNFDRAYINIRATLTPQISARITPDITSIVDQAGVTQWTYQLKYGFVDYTPLAMDNGSSLTFEVGVLPNYWINNIEKYYGWRGVQKTLTDYSWTMSASRSGTTVTRKTGSYFSSADLGMTLKFTFPEKYADLNVAILNGNGYKNLAFDQNRFKDIMATAFIYPLQGMIKKNTDAAKKMNKSRIDGISDLTVGTVGSRADSRCAGFAYMGKLGSTAGTYRLAEVIGTIGMGIMETDYIAGEFRQPKQSVRNLPLTSMLDMRLRTPAQFAGKPVFVYCGGVSVPRGALYMLGLARALRDRGLDFEMRIAGPAFPASLADEMRQFIQAQDLAEHVRLFGEVPYTKSLELIGSATIGLCLLQPRPNYLYAMPVKMIEYMGCGCP